MQKLKVELENCYGINKLNYTFDFLDEGKKGSVYAIYAPNGTMKTSFSKVFKDLSECKESKDRVYPYLKTIRNITIKDSNAISPKEIFVIEPYNEKYRSGSISTLLVNEELKKQYDDIYLNINECKENLLKELKKASCLKNNVEEEIVESFTDKSGDFFTALGRANTEVKDNTYSHLERINYAIIFNDKVLNVIKDADFIEQLKKYINIYEQLIDRSTFFKKGVFNHNNAEDVASNLKNNGWFSADHTVSINTEGKKINIETLKDLEIAIQQEKTSILENAELIASFKGIDDILKKNKELRDFRDYLAQNKMILLELSTIKEFSRRLWIAYLSKNHNLYEQLMSVYGESKENIRIILESAKNEKTKWLEVIDVFNKRFEVPFIVSIENQLDVILKQEIPNIKFEFKGNDNKKNVPIEETELLQVLSNGEKRALYILNIIFEVEARKKGKQETLFIVDDIADSFDYKNKYAIIEYLRDIAQEGIFYQIILSHNFDFYRTISERFGLKATNRLHVVKTNEAIELKQEEYTKNPFTRWKEKLGEDDKILIASISFIRNLAEYCGLEVEGCKLTSLLHIKEDTPSITIKDLQGIIQKVLQDQSKLSIKDEERKVIKVIYEAADNICEDNKDCNALENKIVLSIAIRLKVEEWLRLKLDNRTDFNNNQTRQLINIYKNNTKKSSAQEDNIRLLDKVSLMTPENIHLNSFMYEPILDMSINHLKQLFADVCNLD